jgi:hypothetical protein
LHSEYRSSGAALGEFMRQGHGGAILGARVRFADRTRVSWLALATIGFAGLAVLFLSWPLYRIFLPLEVFTNEPWNAWQTVRALGHGPLYPPPDDLTANNYPPLYFYLVGFLSLFTGDIIITGRFISVAATLGVALATVGCLRQLGVSRAASAFAATWLFATLVRHYEPYVGMNDPHLLALVIMTGALGWFLALHRDGRATEPALAVMVLAGFFKHSLWAVPTTALLWLALHDARRALRAALFSAALAATGVFACLALWGADFYWSMMPPRMVTLRRGFVMLGRLQMIAPALIIWSFWFHACRKSHAARFSALFLGMAFVIYFMQSMGQGVTINAQFELIVATTIGLGLAVDNIAAVQLARRIGLDRARNWLVGLLVVRLLASTHFEPFQILTSSAYRSAIAQQVAVTEAEIARIRALPDPVFCSIGTVCFRAGRSFAYDDFLIGQRVLTGAWSKARLRKTIEQHAVRLEIVDQRAEWDRTIPAIFRFGRQREQQPLSASSLSLEPN